MNLSYELIENQIDIDIYRVESLVMDGQKKFWPDLFDLYLDVVYPQTKPGCNFLDEWTIEFIRRRYGFPGSLEGIRKEYYEKIWRALLLLHGRLNYGDQCLRYSGLLPKTENEMLGAANDGYQQTPDCLSRLIAKLAKLAGGIVSRVTGV